ncbi:histone deacetylase 8-like [Bactrocera neohumeralis]|uniref:histone deacetylase 8-like n=1 Tax=Bactrocera neohumeralis TaxID=98809 RepID=UPI0021657967|nr:histone deacetylase 8-like [Bactrocera neohumeralis]
MQKRNVIYVHNGNLIQQADKNPAVRGRASLTHALIASYGLPKHMQRLEPRICKYTDLRRFHNSAYVEELLKKATLSKPKSTTNMFVKQKTLNDTLEEACSSSSDDEDNNCALDTTYTHIEYGLGFDCPSWRGVWEYACTVAGGTMSACAALCKYGATNNDEQTIIINWTGGWHHAQRDRAAGYCYVNDIVLGILVLRKHFKRVIYVDLDAHHGDGVQQAFEVTKRVFTFSMHRYECGYYPGTGGMDDCGFGEGKGYAANFPYQSGIGGKNFCKYFKRVLTKILQLYKPEVCVIQCGADALVGDPLGGTNLTPADLIECVEFILMNGLPTVLLGGGGYNFTNSSRLWTQLTATCCGVPLPEDIPADNSDFLKYGPDYSVHIKASNFMKDHNNTEYLEMCANTIEDNLGKYNVNAV